MPEDDLSAIHPIRQRLSIVEAALSEMQQRLAALERRAAMGVRGAPQTASLRPADVAEPEASRERD